MFCWGAVLSIECCLLTVELTVRLTSSGSAILTICTCQLDIETPLVGSSCFTSSVPRQSCVLSCLLGYITVPISLQQGLVHGLPFSEHTAQHSIFDPSYLNTSQLELVLNCHNSTQNLITLTITFQRRKYAELADYRRLQAPSRCCPSRRTSRKEACRCTYYLSCHALLSSTCLFLLSSLLTGQL